jgi:hypothetical protein
MKLGTQTGSLTNHILSRAVIGQPTPVVGMGATVLGWTDRHACTIVDVNAFCDTIIVQEDNFTRADDNGISENQTYTYERNPTGAVYVFKKDKHGKWYEVRVNPKTGRYNKTGGPGLRIGERAQYHDFSF